VALTAKQYRLLTPLFQAAGRGKSKAVRRLIAGGADLEARGPLGTTPLYVAVTGGHTEVVRRLTAVGAAVDAPD
jgi:ankyrin repeat protein